MRAVKSSGTKLENQITRELWRKGFRFRKNVKSLFGKPDIAVKKYRAVVFIDSCFWHGCEEHCRLPATNKDFWLAKITRNKRRDVEVTDHYLAEGWHIRRVWEHEMREDFVEATTSIGEFLNEAAKIELDRRKRRIR